MKQKKLPTLIQLRDKAWGYLSKYVRCSQADDQGMALCFTCDAPHHWKDLQGGHFFHGVGKETFLMAFNVHPQCVSCNKHNKGNKAVYAMRLLRRYGAGALLSLERRYYSEFVPTREYYDQKIVELKALYESVQNV